MTPRPSARAYCIMARAAPVAVVLRRGPTKWVQVLLWDLRKDSVIPGQWFRGRIYERRCDLSPKGTCFIYFAASQRPPYATWTAVSRPPYLTALALWPKGDAWGGGGLFRSELEIALNHRPAETKLAPGFKLRKHMRVGGFRTHSGWGEDDPIHAARLERDGWSLEAAGAFEWTSLTSPVRFEARTPQVWSKTSPDGACHLEMRLLGIGVRNGPWYWLEFEAHIDGRRLPLGECDWAELDSNGDLLFSRSGALYRRARRHPALDPRLVADLTCNRFQPRAAPPWARRWR